MIESLCHGVADAKELPAWQHMLVDVGLKHDPGMHQMGPVISLGLNKIMLFLVGVRMRQV